MCCKSARACLLLVAPQRQPIQSFAPRRPGRWKSSLVTQFVGLHRHVRAPARPEHEASAIVLRNVSAQAIACLGFQLRTPPSKQAF